MIISSFFSSPQMSKSRAYDQHGAKFLLHKDDKNLQVLRINPHSTVSIIIFLSLHFLLHFEFFSFTSQKSFKEQLFCFFPKSPTLPLLVSSSQPLEVFRSLPYKSKQKIVIFFSAAFCFFETSITPSTSFPVDS